MSARLALRGRKIAQARLAMLVGMVVLSACTGPAYFDRSEGRPNAVAQALGPVVFEASAELARTPPSCIAIMPFPSVVEDDEAPAGHARRVRRAIYAQLAPRTARDVELAAIDARLDAMSPAQLRNYGLIGWRLGCGNLLFGIVTDYRERYLGLYSEVAVGAELELVRARDGEVLWRAEHVATTRGGGLPLSPLGLVEGAARAAANVLEDEQLDRVTEDLARRLVRALPEAERPAGKDAAAGGLIWQAGAKAPMGGPRLFH